MLPGIFMLKTTSGMLPLAAEGDGRQVHDAQLPFQHLVVGQFLEELGVVVGFGVGTVDAVDLGGFEQNVGADFGGTQGGAGVGGEKGVSGSGGENDDAAFFQMADGPQADKGFADAVHADGRKNARRLAQAFHGFAQGQGVDDGGEHAHVIGGGAFDVAVLGKGGSADEIPAADHDRQLHAGLGNLQCTGGR